LEEGAKFPFALGPKNSLGGPAVRSPQEANANLSMENTFDSF
jgi:hypothetical protein